MSVVFPGGSGITISPGQSQTWTFNWNDLDWMGITILQPQPTEAGWSLNYSETTVAARGVGAALPAYSFTMTVTNPTDSVVTFNIQTSWFQ